jgi:hypothetical protein
VYAAIANSDFLFPLKRITGWSVGSPACHPLLDRTSRSIR